MENEPILEITGAGKAFELYHPRKSVTAFENVSISAADGEFTALVGHSGSGKSSLLKCLYRTYKPTNGRFLYSSNAYGRVDLATASDSQILDLRRTEIRFVQQFLRVVPRQSAVTTVARQLRLLGYDEPTSAERSRELLDKVGLSSRLWELPPHNFSGGERQMVNLACALAVPPRLLLLDEPVASLDPDSKERVLGLLEHAKSQGIALIGIFHDFDIVSRLAERVIQFGEGTAREIDRQELNVSDFE